MRENVTVFPLQKPDLPSLLERLKTEPSFKEKHLVILLQGDNWHLKDLKPLVAIAKQYHKKFEKLIVVVSATLEYEEGEIALNVVPTEQEAYDLIEIDEIERDLWK
nr:hypothetical protein [uncultured Capnocytophaga sp.]